MRLNELAHSSSNPLLESMVHDLTSRQRYIVEGIVNEVALTVDQINQLFGQVQQASTAAGGNRTILGKGIDVANAANQVINKIGGWLQNTAPVQNFDAKFEQLKANIVDKLGQDSTAVKTINAMSEFAKQNPGKTAAIIGVLTAVASVAGGPVGGAIAGQILRGSAELLRGEKLSTAVGKGLKTAAVGAGLSWLAGTTLNAVKAGLTVAIPEPPPVPNVKELVAPKLSWQVNGRTVFALDKVPMPAETATKIRTLIAQASDSLVNDPNKASGYLAQARKLVSDPTLADQVRNIAQQNAESRAAYSAAMQAWDESAGNIAIFNDQLTNTIDSLKSATGGVIQGAAAASNLDRQKNLSEAQIMVAMSLIEAGMWDKVKGLAGKAASAVAGKVATKAANLTTKVTADKLMKAWKASGSPTDSDAIYNVIKSAGVDDATIGNVFKSMNIEIPTPAAVAQTTPTQAAEPTAAQATPSPAPAATPVAAKQVPQATKPSVAPTTAPAPSYGAMKPATVKAKPGAPIARPKPMSYAGRAGASLGQRT